MHLTLSSFIPLLGASVLVAAAPQAQPSELPVPEFTADLGAAADSLASLAQLAQSVVFDDLQTASKKRATQSCNASNLIVRKDWVMLSTTEKKNYISAVQCLQNKPPRTPSAVAAGAKSRYDDFVVTHIQQTLTIHYTGTFLAWHRYFIWTYEKALRDECGYTGYQPYWNWAETAVMGFENHPLFDGSDTSLSGNGVPVPNQGPIIVAAPGLPDIVFPSGTGGGCIQSGPFKGLQINLGPAALNLPGGNTSSVANPLDYNPRCVKRDLTLEINRSQANASSILHLILANNNINDFQLEFQGTPGAGNIGVHGGGHYTMGGDPGRDFFTAPADPLFFVHHGMVDRVWWIWQQIDRANRLNEVAGTLTFMNLPPSANATLDTVIDLGYAAGSGVPPLKIRDLVSTTDGPFCYVYL